MCAMPGNRVQPLDNLQVLSENKRRHYARLKQKKFRDQEGLFLAEGLRAVQQLLKNRPTQDMLELIVVSEKFQAYDELGSAKNNKVFALSQKDFKTISDTDNTQGICAVFKQPRFDFTSQLGACLEKKKSLIVVCDGLQDPGNLGTILRTAAWFNVDLLVCGLNTVDIYNPKTIRSSAGSCFAMPIIQEVDLIKTLPKLIEIGFSVYATALNGLKQNQIKVPDKAVLIIGNEGNGVSEEVLNLCPNHITIPGNANAVESLNASVTAGILISFFAN